MPLKLIGTCWNVNFYHERNYASHFKNYYYIMFFKLDRNCNLYTVILLPLVLKEELHAVSKGLKQTKTKSEQQRLLSDFYDSINVHVYICSIF